MSSFRFFGDISWFSERKTAKSYKGVSHALYSHLRYISNSKREDLVYSEGVEWKKWKKICEEEVAKRWDARVAGKFMIALPNSLDKQEAIKFVREFVENEIQPTDYGFAIHKNQGKISNQDNLHAHIIFSARGKDGKKLRLGRKELKRLQKRYDELLEKYGFKPKKSEVKHVRVSQYDVIHNLEAVKEIRKAVNEMKKFIEEAKKKTQEIKESINKTEIIDKKLLDIFNRTGHNVMKFVKTALAEGYEWQDIKKFFEATGREEHIKKIELRLFQNNQKQHKQHSYLDEIAEKLLRAKQEQERKQIRRFRKKFRY